MELPHAPPLHLGPHLPDRHAQPLRPRLLLLRPPVRLAQLRPHGPLRPGRGPEVLDLPHPRARPLVVALPPTHAAHLLPPPVLPPHRCGRTGGPRGGSGASAPARRRRAGVGERRVGVRSRARRRGPRSPAARALNRWLCPVSERRNSFIRELRSLRHSSPCCPRSIPTILSDSSARHSSLFRTPGLPRPSSMSSSESESTPGSGPCSPPGRPLRPRPVLPALLAGAGKTRAPRGTSGSPPLAPFAGPATEAGTGLAGAAPPGVGDTALRAALGLPAGGEAPWPCTLAARSCSLDWSSTESRLRHPCSPRFCSAARRPAAHPEHGTSAGPFPDAITVASPVPPHTPHVWPARAPSLRGGPGRVPGGSRRGPLASVGGARGGEEGALTSARRRGACAARRPTAGPGGVFGHSPRLF